MSIKLMDLPYEKDALQPYMSKETLDYHHDKHHKKYVETLNKLIVGTEYEKCTLEEIVQGSYQDEEQKKIFNNAGQAWNHNFFWQCLNPDKTAPDGTTKDLIGKSFGTFEDFKTNFTKVATELFGSGWAWLIYEDNKLKIEGMSNAGTPIAEDRSPILTCDVWEHAYYIDYRNERPKFLDAFWNLVNWEFVAEQISLFSGSPKTNVRHGIAITPPIQ